MIDSTLTLYLDLISQDWGDEVEQRSIADAYGRHACRLLRERGAPGFILSEVVLDTPERPHVRSLEATGSLGDWIEENTSETQHTLEEAFRLAL